ncbi:conserved Plasmodium protein, unknown function [Plasmodium gallinaceum]|uniref:Uncharacterized protein n=1 Tax=Plasmodium gallinaceum TaxID=5849 RepID=A0A1J1GNI2_PLAGA|nr:conserved Plasmodium protein, unknown function [Plasmodium gallinaceum]CRG93838.1 conserved Plasmodium protein, unknown function [Plasmodium gallinaceum]
MKKIKLNVTREEDNLQSNIYYVCEKNILISQLNLTINYDENHLTDEEVIEKDNSMYLNYDKNKANEEKKKNINIKISYSDELNNLYFNNVLNNIYDYIFEYKTNNLNINKNHSWYIFINIYIYEYTPYIYDHICNVINVHLSLLLIPFCFYDFDCKWYRSVENYEELYKLLSYNVSANSNKTEDGDKQTTYLKEKSKLEIYEKDSKSEKDEMESYDVLILDKHEQNKNIIINQLENNNFDLFVEIKNNNSSGLFKRLLIEYIPILTTINVDDQFVYVIKFIDFRDFLLNTQNRNDNIYNNIIETYKFLNFTQFTKFEMNNINNDKKFELDENYYFLFNANNTSIDKDNVLKDSKSIIQFYYNFILNYCLNYFVDNYLN